LGALSNSRYIALESPAASKFICIRFLGSISCHSWDVRLSRAICKKPCHWSTERGVFNHAQIVLLLADRMSPILPWKFIHWREFSKNSHSKSTYKL
jgi:hypothetical protein